MSYEALMEKIIDTLDADLKGAAIIHAGKVSPSEKSQIAAALGFQAGAAWFVDRLPMLLPALMDAAMSEPPARSD